MDTKIQKSTLNQNSGSSNPFRPKIEVRRKPFVFGF